MKIVFSTLLFTFLFNWMAFSQELIFEPALPLFVHPNQPASENFGFGLPFIPLDYNQDGHTDFIGSTFDERYLVKGFENNIFENLNISYDGQPFIIIDFDQDGDEDLISEHGVYLYTEADNFEPLDENILFPETIVAVEDFNDDGFFDLLTVDSEPFEDDFFVLHLNNGDHTFTSSVIYEGNHRYGVVEVGDVDNDGSLDIVALTNVIYEEILILYNNGENDFFPIFLETPFFFSDDNLIVEDIDADNDLDILTGESSHGIYIFENTDNFLISSEFTEINEFGLQFFQTGDLNNDGLPEILTVSGGGSGFRVKHFLNKGNAEFDASVIIGTFPGSSFVGFPPNPNLKRNNLSVYDYDYDGKKDLIYVSGVGSDPKQIFLLKNDSDFTSPTTNIENKNFQLSLFPNPAQDELSVQVISSTVHLLAEFEIRNTIGQRIYQATLQVAPFKMDISTWTPGTYYFQMVINGEVQIERFVKI